MKKTFCILLAVVLLLSLQLFPTVHGSEYDDLCQLLIESYESGSTVSISQFGVNEDRLDAAFVDVWYGGKLPWNAESYRYSVNDSGVVLSFSPIYYDEASYDYASYERAIAEMIDEVILPDMTQWEKALAIHDYLIVNTSYDESLQRNTNYDILVNHNAVCSGYAMAYMDVMNRLGIECRFVDSQSMEHAWNIIKIDGAWYHVDLTWDDPTPDSYGFVSHEHFLKTDKEMEALGYSDWNTDISCTDETFTDPLWKEVNSRICFTDSALYLRRKNNWDYTITALTETETTLYTLPAQGLAIGDDPSDSYHYEHNGLSLWNGRLWFSDVSRVYSMNPDGTDLQTVFLYDVQANHKFIYGSFVNEGILYLTLSDSEYGYSTQTVPLENSDYHTHSYTVTTLEATCTEAGGTVQICQCGLSYSLDTIPATGHTYESYISQQATCQAEGEKTFVCATCGDSYTETFSDANAHSYESITVREASFFKEGQKYMTCQLCDYATYESIPRQSFQKSFGLTVWSTLSVIILLAVMPILIISSRKKKK